MAHEFKCDRCNQFESVKGNRQYFETKYSVTLSVSPTDDDSDCKSFELCGKCSSELKQWLTTPKSA